MLWARAALLGWAGLFLRVPARGSRPGQVSPEATAERLGLDAAGVLVQPLWCLAEEGSAVAWLAAFRC